MPLRRASSQAPAAAAGAESSVKNEHVDSPDADADVAMSDEDDEFEQSPGDSAPSTSEKGKEKAAGSTATPSLPMQKRRRVTRACDECRRKKIKCDGKQPCGHCDIYDYECTYDKPSQRRRNPAHQYVEAIEQRLLRAETMLRTLAPDIDLNDPTLDQSLQQQIRSRAQQARGRPLARDDASIGSSSSKDPKLHSMISRLGHLDLDEKGEFDFHGLSSGTVFFRRMKDHFKTLLGGSYKIPTLPRGPRPSGLLGFDSPRSYNASAASTPSAPSSQNPYELPPKEVALRLCRHALNYGTSLLRIVHIPSFYAAFDALFAKMSDDFTEEETRKLALLYSVLALGSMYDVHDDDQSTTPPYEVAMQEGLRYYNSAKFLLGDVTECRDLTSLQTLLFMILFIQAISNLSTCYGFVGIALRSALRMGLHRHLPQAQVNSIDSETRKRVFYVCRQLDTYVSALLGFPLLLSDEDVDQPLPVPVDDEYITKDEIRTMPPGSYSFFEAFNAHARLMAILSKVVKNIYPLKGLEKIVLEGEQPSSTYTISYKKVKEMETKLQEWSNDLPVAWRPNPDGPEEVVRVRNLLRFAYAHVQMVLYRPFLHYVSPKVSKDKADDCTYACGAAGISVARNIVHIGTEMRKQVSLVGPYWFTFFTEFFAIISLVFYVLENQDKPGIMDYLADAVAGKEMISGLARSSMAADRITNALNILFDQLPDNLKKVKANAIPTKKRSATGSKIFGMGFSPSSINVKPKFARQGDSRSKSGSSNAGRTSTVPSNASVNAGTTADLSTVPYPQGFIGVPSLNMATSGPMASGPMPGQGPVAGINPLRLDTMMFASGDPLAYPAQPVFEFGGMQREGTQAPSPQAVPTQQDGSQFFVPNLYDTQIEGQLMGPLPPFMMQTSAHTGFTLPAHVYSDPMMGFQMQQQQQQQRGQLFGQPQAQPAPPQQQQQPNFNNIPWGTNFNPYI